MYARARAHSFTVNLEITGVTRRVGRFFSKLVHVLSMARLRVRSRFWKTIINPRRRHRVEGGLREDGRYEIRISQRRREAWTGHIKANYGTFGAGAGATLSQVSYNRDTLLHGPATAMHARAAQALNCCTS